MGREEIKIQWYRKRNWLGRLRFNFRIVDTSNGKTLAATNQGYSRLKDMHATIGKIQRYSCVCDVEEVAA